MKPDPQLAELLRIVQRAKLTVSAVETEWREVDGVPVRVCRVVCQERTDLYRKEERLG